MNLTLALDWTPNVNHIGFYVAQARGWYKDAGISLALTDPSVDNYALTPAKKVELGLAHMALCPLESVISYRTKSNAFDMMAIASIMQEDLSAIVVKDSDNISRPGELDGKVYASYAAKYEDAIVREMIMNDGGAGEIDIEYPQKLSIWNEFVSGKSDATWIFLNWEAIHVDAKHQQMRYFKMRDFNVPYSYSPIIAVGRTTLAAHSQSLRQFLLATKEGFLDAMSDREYAKQVMHEHLPEADKDIDLDKAIEVTSQAIGDQQSWGLMQTRKVNAFLQWLKDRRLEVKPFVAQDICTNNLFTLQRNTDKA